VKAILNLIRRRILILLALLANPALIVPAFAIWDKPSSRVYVCALSDNYHLVVNYCVDTCDDTSTWHWADQGTM
jgi:hypothetical protein